MLWSDALFGYRVGSGRGDLTFDRRDSARAMPKGVVVDNSFNWGNDRPPMVPWDRTVIYEAHVRGLTYLNDMVPPRERGTFAALANPHVIDHLQRLGITAIELLPVHAFMQDRFLVERRLRNYWGYSTLSYFAPEPRYLVEPWMRNQVKVAVRRLHAAGIEVILDVVYNHTCEGNEMGPTLSCRGLDNASITGSFRVGTASHQRHRHRQYSERAASAGVANGHRQSALLGGDITSTDSGSISARSSGVSRMASIRAPAFSTRCARIRCFRG